MKRYGSESYAQLEDIDNSFKVLRTQSIQTGIKQAKQVIRSLYDKARSVYVQESAKMYYNGCLEIGNKILAIKKPPKPNLPDYKASIEAANRTSEDLNAELSRFLAVHAKLLETENSIKHMQRRIENATDQIPLLKSDILRLISDLTTSQAEYLNLKLTHNALKKKIKIFKSNTSQTSNISIEIPEIPNFTNEKHGLEQETMIYEDNLTKYRNKLNFYSYLQNSINLVQSSIENISLNIKEYASESVKIINDIQELETNLVAKLNEVQSLENSVNIKENTKQTLYETHETTLMKLEDLLITKICIHKKHKNAYKKVQELEELKKDLLPEINTFDKTRVLKILQAYKESTEPAYNNLIDFYKQKYYEKGKYYNLNSSISSNPRSEIVWIKGHQNYIVSLDCYGLVVVHETLKNQSPILINKPNEKVSKIAINDTFLFLAIKKQDKDFLSFYKIPNQSLINFSPLRAKILKSLKTTSENIEDIDPKRSKIVIKNSDFFEIWDLETGSKELYLDLSEDLDAKYSYGVIIIYKQEQLDLKIFIQNTIDFSSYIVLIPNGTIPYFSRIISDKLLIGMDNKCIQVIDYKNPENSYSLGTSFRYYDMEGYDNGFILNNEHTGRFIGSPDPINCGMIDKVFGSYQDKIIVYSDDQKTVKIYSKSGLIEQFPITFGKNVSYIGTHDTFQQIYVVNSEGKVYIYD